MTFYGSADLNDRIIGRWLKGATTSNPVKTVQGTVIEYYYSESWRNTVYMIESVNGNIFEVVYRGTAFVPQFTPPPDDPE